jgi:tetratricopeptide (TPR) repeat protein
VTSLPVAEAGARLRERPIRSALAAALDHWASLRRAGKLGDPARWKDLLEVARLADPDDGARNRVRLALEQDERWDIEELAQAKVLETLPVPTVVFLGDILVEWGRREQALSVFQHAVARQPSDLWANDRLGECYRYMSPPQWDRAEGNYRAALAVRPDNYILLNTLGMVLEKQGRRKEAEPLFRRAVALNPKYAWAHQNLGGILEQLDRLDESAASLRRALELRPDFPLALNNLALTLCSQGKAGEAITLLTDALRRRPDAVWHYPQLGNAFMRNGQPQEAIKNYLKSIQDGTEVAWSYNNLGVAFRELGHWDESVVSCCAALSLKEDFPEAFSNLGCALRGLGRTDEALTCFERALLLKPAFADAYDGQGWALWTQGRLEEAVASYQKAVHLAPKHFWAHNHLSVALRQLGRLDESIASCRTAQKLMPKAPEPYFNLGLAWQLQGKFQAALDAFQKCQALAPRRPLWPEPSGEWVQKCKRRVELESRLPAVLAGTDKAANPGEAVEFAEMCGLKRLYATAACFYRKAVLAPEVLAGDLLANRRYDAACAAALAGCGKGEDAAPLTADERAYWRQQALAWLRTDLSLWIKEVEGGKPAVRQEARQRLAHWQRDPDLEGLRAADALSRLPEAEQQQCLLLWAEVATLRERAGRP